MSVGPTTSSTIPAEFGERMSRLPKATPALGTDRREDDPSGLKFIIEHERRDVDSAECGRGAIEPLIDPSGGV